MATTEFSEYSIEEMTLKFGEGEAIKAGCIGTCEETLDVRVLTKKCKGVITKTVTKPTGTGALKITGHMLLDAYYKMHGMDNDKLKDGIKAFGSNQLPQMCVCLKVSDEEGNIKLKAYPNATCSSGPSRKIDANAEEIAEVEVSIAISSDEHNECLYEQIIIPETDEALITKWMTNFDYSIVKKEGS